MYAMPRLNLKRRAALESSHHPRYSGEMLTKLGQNRDATSELDGSTVQLRWIFRCSQVLHRDGCTTTNPIGAVSICEMYYRKQAALLQAGPPRPPKSNPQLWNNPVPNGHK